MEREQREIPKEFLPFASDGAHAVVYLDLTPEGKGKVVASLDGYVWTGGQDDGYIVLVPSFAGYMEMLFKCEDDIKHQPPSNNSFNRSAKNGRVDKS